MDGDVYRWQVKRGFVYYGPGNRDKNSSQRNRNEVRLEAQVFFATQSEVKPELYKLRCLGPVEVERPKPKPKPATEEPELPPKRSPGRLRKIVSVDTAIKEPPETT